MSFPAYPGYKHSGVELLGELPEHWTLKRFKNVFEERAERSADGLEELLSVSAYFGIKPRSESRDEGDHLSRAESLEGYKVCHPGDLVINIMLAWNRGLGFSWQSGIVSPAYCVFHVTDGSSPKFLDYLVRSDECIRYFKTHSAGIMDSRLRLYPESFGRLFTAIPPTCEQTQIARFLDHETARIDALIEKQQRLIELLKEKRQAVISHAVTKGLDPMVPMKDSGVEWLGEVPAHWDVARVKNVAKLESGHTPSKDFPEYWEGGDIPWVSLNDSKKLKIVDYIEETQFMITELGVSNSSARLLPARAVVFTRDASIGLAAITTKKMCVSQHLIAWICNESLVLPEYLLLVFYAMEQELDRFTFGATIKTIGMPDIRKLLTTVPPLVEQTQIVADLNVKRELIERLIQESNTALTLHSERRSALISAAVTGKIDVRGWQPPASAPIPELAQEAV
ncbi:restriction endonuclease subunit S [Pseudomonas sp. MWU12-2115]|uniref:restriction endonuclease subunit S n=1 Tax=unclassified Pseudomonas TaxID=196821 RepID=UPI000CD4D1FC|nr:restriction endonuclease subunit S [Pseudomonas sp. MWU12-2020]RBC00670.1 restriction endonuclease subunit S [Pseudomonas sp. MWU12-2115]